MGDVADPRAVSRDVFSATLGSVCCCYTGQPLDTIKVRMQTSPGEYTSFISTTAKIFRNEVGCCSMDHCQFCSLVVHALSLLSTRIVFNVQGLAAFWKGAVPTAMGMALENAMAFGVNEALKRAFPDDEATKIENVRPDLVKPFFMVSADRSACGELSVQDEGSSYRVGNISHQPCAFFLL